MIEQDLNDALIWIERPYEEGAVELLEQIVPDVEPTRATLTITALGLYEASIDGAKVGEAMLAPGYTYYPHDLRYQSYDVTSMLHPGSHLCVLLAQGWYCGRFGCDNKTQLYGSAPSVAWLLDIEGEDGSVHRLTSADDSVRAKVSPYDYAGLYDGEIYWAEGASEKRPQTPEVVQPSRSACHLPDNLVASRTEVRLHETIDPISVTEHGQVTILDFGQNMAAVIEIDPTLVSSDCITIRHGEILDEDGNLYTRNLRRAKATIVYHKGSEHEIWRPRFTYMGFRFVELSGSAYRPGMLRARPIHTSMDQTGRFSSGHEGLNRLYMNQIWSQRSNYVGIPTDCPQRDERQGYTGDAHVFALTASYNYDVRAFMNEFLCDIRMTQLDNSEGYVGPIAPATGPTGVGFITMQGWGSADTIIPWMLYEQYGDDSALRMQYPSMLAHTDCELAHAGEGGLWLAPNLGDWLAPGVDVAWAAQHSAPVSNAFLIRDLDLTARAARYLGNSADAKRLEAAAARCRAAYRDSFLTPDGRMTDGYQGALVLALNYVIEQGPAWEATFSQLVEDVETHGLRTGFFSTEHLLGLLADNGEARLAYDLLLQDGCPGWMYQVRKGATTIWERWDAIRPDGSVNEDQTSEQSSENMVSFNHYAFGSVGAFLYRHILGIAPIEPGYRRVRIEPRVDRRLGHAQGEFRSVAGDIRVSWDLERSEATLDVELPVSGEVLVPDGSRHAVGAGSHHFTFEFEPADRLQ
ncbi:alpha-L-rhamnosidase [Coriobacterium glomerans PW2]|uniref:alpha-L-rhamnosidase n=1 Tax=Coriobacterium glomerans (strain ATCC 49209 / DSM 20642 / JCM 10262 / PW2) TaxID=700015 RepID=F2NA40_CORGP|nr:alpha-L-rhamnosidase [Coriobacterium glomerans]AEB06434.1 alpha-L-rhamnosidase [Coriobacterium glomerans PW2]